MGRRNSGDYFGMGGLISVILCIFLGPLMGVLQRIGDRCYVAAIVRIMLGWNLIWALDFLCLLFTGRIFRLLMV